MPKRTNYDRGREIEYKVVNELKEQDWYNPVRTAGSHGMFDVIAFNRDQVMLVQVKRSKTPVTFERLYKEDLLEILKILPELSRDVQVEAWVWVDRKGFTQKLIIKPSGRHFSKYESEQLQEELEAGNRSHWLYQDDTEI